MAARIPAAAALALVTASVLAGCLGSAPGPVAQEGGLAARMLALPPGADVQPTGRTVHFTLYLHRIQHELYPGATMAMWGFSLSDDPATASVPGPELRVTEGASWSPS